MFGLTNPTNLQVYEFCVFGITNLRTQDTYLVADIAWMGLCR